jgi:hypothetical protein
VHAACVAGGYLVCVASLFTLQVGAGLNVPISLAVAAPPLVYAALAMLLLRDAAFVRRLSWLGGACLVHIVLALLAATELVAGGLSLGTALAQVFVLFPPAPLLTLIATPLTLAAFGLTASKPAQRAEPKAPRPVTVARSRAVVSPPRAAGTVAESPPSAGWTTAPPTTRVAPAAVPVAPPPATPPPAIVAPAPAAPNTNGPKKRSRVANDGMVRVPFERIAAQLPAEAFVLPFERLGESLREPQVVLVPRRVVLSQMRDGAVAITWAHIASQFPELALRMTDEEFRKQYPDLKLMLPVDELDSQLTPDGVGSTVAAPSPAVARPSVARERADVAPASSPNLVEAAPPVRPAAAPSTAPPAAPTSLQPAPSAPVPPEIMDRGTLARIVACFGGVGTFEAAAERSAGSVVVALIEPGVSRKAAIACASRLMPFLAGMSAEVVTVRTGRTVLVLAAASTPIVVAVHRPNASVALLALRALGAAAIAGIGAPIVLAPPPRDLEPLGADARVARTALALRGSGAAEPTVFADATARVYVFGSGGNDSNDKRVAALALGVVEAIGDGGELGAPAIIVFRRGAEHTVIRPLFGGAGILAATGAVTRAGRIIRDAERAAAVLESP